MLDTTIVGIDPGHSTGIAILCIEKGSERLAFFDKFVGTQEEVADCIRSTIARKRQVGHRLFCIVERAVFRGSCSATKQGAMINRATGEFFYGTLWNRDFWVCMKTPMEWKGNTPKAIIHSRVLRVFGDQLLEITGLNNFAELTKQFPDPLDALGIAMAGSKNLAMWF